MKPFNWKCPYCDHAQVVTDNNHDSAVAVIQNAGSRHGLIKGFVETTVCANQDCRELTLELRLYRVTDQNWLHGTPIHSWSLLPESTARPQPEYIPAPIVDNYRQACRIKDLSPNASAAMSRRCLQGMIRDFWQVQGERTLWDEIQAIKDRVDPTTWEAIDAVREVGNIGAHMKQDVNLILDVEPDEAQVLIGLIEMLFKDWYIDRHERAKRLDAVAALGRMKKAQTDAAAGKNLED